MHDQRCQSKGFRHSSRINAIAYGVLTLTLIATLHTPAWSQNNNATKPSPSPTLVPQPLSRWFAVNNPGELATAQVQLDGYTLFPIAAPPVAKDDQQQKGPTPVEQRLQGIERTLERLSVRNLDPKTLQVTSELDPNSGLPVISVNDQYLMTVTTLDAQLQGRPPEQWAQELTQIIRQSLIRAQQERQSSYLTRQGVLSCAIVVAMVLTSTILSRWQRQLKRQQEHLETQLPTNPITDTEAVSLESASQVKTQIQRWQQRNLSDMRRRLLQLGQVGIWGGGAYVLLGLFPYTRWLQPFIFSAPLRVIGIILSTYVLLRITDVLIDRFLNVLETGEFIDPGSQVSQRLALRISTVSKVMKSVAAIVWVGAGFLTALSAIGVNLVPLLAGAGIIGLAISFASQSLIKDMINGFLILLEDQYAVGDVIAIGTASGFVESMNLRMTQLRNAEGRLITIPNGAITVVENLSKNWSRVDLAIDIAYHADVNRAIELITQIAHDMDQDSRWAEKILEPPEVLGVEEIDQAGVTIRVWIKTQPLQQWNVAREFRRRLKVALDVEGISIGVPQQTVWYKAADDSGVNAEKTAESKPNATSAAPAESTPANDGEKQEKV